MDDIHLPVKQNIFNQMIKPLLKHEPMDILYFYEQAWRAWKLNLEDKDIEYIMFIEKFCMNLFEDNKEALIKTIEDIFANLHNSRSITERVLGKVYSDKQDNDEKYSNILELIKTLLESEYKLWGSIPYLFYAQYIDITSQIKDNKYVDLGGGTKLAKIKLKNNIFWGCDLDYLSIGFDNKIRSAGYGHDDWEILDNGNVLLRVKSIKKQKIKIKEIELTYEKLKEISDSCIKTLLIIELGVMIFLTNNPDINKNINRKTDLKIKEIERQLRVFIEQRQLKLDFFLMSEDRKEVSMKLSKKLIISGTGGKLYTPVGVSNIYTDKTKVYYKYQIYGIIRFLLQLNDDNGFNINITVNDDSNKKIIDVRYSSNEVIRLLDKGTKTLIPENGEMPDISYELILETLL